MTLSLPFSDFRAALGERRGAGDGAPAPGGAFGNVGVAVGGHLVDRRLDRGKPFLGGHVGQRRDRPRRAAVVRAAALRRGGAVRTDIEILLHVASAGCCRYCSSVPSFHQLFDGAVSRPWFVAFDLPAVAGLVGREHRHEHGRRVAEADAGVGRAALGRRVVDVVGIGPRLDAALPARVGRRSSLRSSRSRATRLAAGAVVAPVGADPFLPVTTHSRSLTRFMSGRARSATACRSLPPQPAPSCTRCRRSSRRACLASSSVDQSKFS